MSKESISEYTKHLEAWRADWSLFARQVLKVTLDEQQAAILRDIQTERRVSVRSGTSRGKDFVAAVASLCFLYLTPSFDKEGNFHSAKVVNTAPTGRQIKNIMMPEISKLFNKAKFLPGNLQSKGIRFDDYKEWFLDGFKAEENNVEAWSGLHAPNIMVVVTEASGVSQTMFDSIEGVLQGNSRLVLIFNPNRTTGEAYYSTRSPLYTKHKLNCLDAPNVINKVRQLNGEITEDEYNKLHIPGQVDYDWVDEKFKKPGWVTQVNEKDVDPGKLDINWGGKWYRPGTLFRVKVLGEFPEEGDDVLIPLNWIEAANERWKEIVEKAERKSDPLRLGVDIAGMGRDNSVFTFRYENFVKEFKTISNIAKKATIHMEVAGQVVDYLQPDPRTKAYIDTIGEGAGVYSRLNEQGFQQAISVKASYGTGGLTDETGERSFNNMRSYLYWMIRDALDPSLGGQLALPYDEELTEELCDITYKFTSNGKIQLEPKDDIKKRIGRSPDKADSLSLTYFPDEFIDTSEEEGEEFYGIG